MAGEKGCKSRSGEQGLFVYKARESLSKFTHPPGRNEVLSALPTSRLNDLSAFYHPKASGRHHSSRNPCAKNRPRSPTIRASWQTARSSPNTTHQTLIQAKSDDNRKHKALRRSSKASAFQVPSLCAAPDVASSSTKAVNSMRASR